MKKSLIALAALAAAGVASAQSSVTLFGIIDTQYQNLSADRAPSATSAATKAKLSRLHNSGYNTSRLGFRGTEDLGGGMSASFWLEAQLMSDDGTGGVSSSTNRAIPPFAGTTTSSSTNGANAPVRSGTQGLTFNRRSTVSLAGPFGEVRLGRDYVPAFWNQTVFDPFGTNGVGAQTNITQNLGSFLGVPTITRASNSIGYFLPGNLGGFYGQAMYAFGEVAEPVVGSASNLFNDKKDGRHMGLRLGFATGPFNVAAAYGVTEATGAANLAGATLLANQTATLATGFLTTTAIPTTAQLTAVAAEGRTKYKNANVGGQYDLGVAKILALWNQEKIEDFKHTSWMIGTLVPVGAGEIRASYTRGKSTDNEIKGRQIAVGYVHNLSKRTAVYTTYARLNNSGSNPFMNYSQAGTTLAPTSTGGDARGWDIGIRHSF
jgi:predicted porin